MSHRNILFITADQWRGECLSFLGHPTVKTPNLDTLAKDGVTFTRHFAQCTPCGPSRASLHTGMYLQNHRMIANGTPLDRRHTNIALELRKIGYAPTLVGYTDIGQDPRRYAPGDPVLKNYEQVLPGFERVLAMSTPDHPQDWARWLSKRGFILPENPGDLYRKQVANYPGVGERGRTLAPAIYSAEESEAAFVTETACDYIRLPDARPWFLHVSYLAPHPPYLAPEPYNRMYEPDDVPDFKGAETPEKEAEQHPYLALLLRLKRTMGSQSEKIYPRDEKSMRQLRATYYGMMALIDDQIGAVIRTLQETGQYEDTVIIFASDHGDQLGDHHLLGKGAYFDQCFHVPLIVRAPGDAKACARGQKVSAFTENIDILPTVTDFLGLDRPRQCDGLSLVPFLRGETPANWRNEAHFEIDFRYSDSFPRVPIPKELGIPPEACVLNAVRGERYKYIHFAGLESLFFDLQKDPAELVNLARDPAYALQMIEYTQKMLTWRMTHDERTLTHLLAGPDGMKPHHFPDDYSPC
jgi:arylsulfatase A-like enzyme